MDALEASMHRALEWLGGSVVVYGIVVACSGGPYGERAVGVDSGSPGAGGMVAAGGGSHTNDSGVADVLADALDAMTDPVPDADAAPMPPQPAVTTVPCSSTLQHGATNQDFAELSVPGRSAASLAGTVALLNVGQTEGYPYSAVAYLAVRDGGVAAACGFDETLTVTFVVPPA
jgi:hypothetical protein